MNEHEACQWLKHGGVSRETHQMLREFVRLVVEENHVQNLIGRNTEPQIWARHIVDSAQLIPEDKQFESWLDLGSGAGFPGIITAILTGVQTTLVEPRRKRIKFLLAAKKNLSLDHVTVAGCRLEALRTASYDVISARAFAPLPRLFELAHSFSTEKTLWLLPKGRSAREELEMAKADWQGDFQLKPSVTDPDASIIMATKVRPRAQTR